MHAPHGAVGTEPARIADGRGEFHAAEEAPPHGVVQPLVDHLPDYLVWQEHESLPRDFWSRL